MIIEFCGSCLVPVKAFCEEIQGVPAVFDASAFEILDEDIFLGCGCRKGNLGRMLRSWRWFLGLLP